MMMTLAVTMNTCPIIWNKINLILFMAFLKQSLIKNETKSKQNLNFIATPNYSAN